MLTNVSQGPRVRAAIQHGQGVVSSMDSCDLESSENLYQSGVLDNIAYLHHLAGTMTRLGENGIADTFEDHVANRHLRELQARTESCYQSIRDASEPSQSREPHRPVSDEQEIGDALTYLSQDINRCVETRNFEQTSNFPWLKCSEKEKEEEIQDWEREKGQSLKLTQCQGAKRPTGKLIPDLVDPRNYTPPALTSSVPSSTTLTRAAESFVGLPSPESLFSSDEPLQRELDELDLSEDAMTEKLWEPWVSQHRHSTIQAIAHMRLSS